MHIVAEDVPPELYQIGGVRILCGRQCCAVLGIELYEPWLQFARKMQNLNLISEPTKRKLNA